tara:strand:+ start:49 stop:264 length:216 start_codon:yes stop_codon:yes gene_type:complete
MHKKSVIYQPFPIIFVLLLFFILISCSFTTKDERIDCSFNPDYEKIGTEAMESMDNMKNINLNQLKAACNF